jgi:hypothetical protein
MERKQMASGDRFLTHRIAAENRAQWMAFVLSLMGLGVAIVLALKGLGWNAAIAVSAVFGALGTVAGLALRGRKKRDGGEPGEH